MPNYTVTPAYGRDYTTASQAISAWYDGRDFLISTYIADPSDGRKINRADADSARVSVRIRYCRLTKITRAILPNSPPPAPRAPRRILPPAPACPERFCGRPTRRKSGYCARHDSDVWRRIRARRAADISEG